MAKHKVDITGVHTNELKVLTSEEMENLFKKYQEGDLKAREELVNGNLKLVLSILKRFNNRDENMDDLFQIGCVGLLKAVDNFDLSYGVKFSTYCVPMVLGEVKRYLTDNNSIRVSRSLKDIAYKVLKLKDEMAMVRGKEPSNSEIAKELGVEESDIILALESLKPPVSLFEPIYNDGGDTIYLSDQLADHKNDLYDKETRMSVQDALMKIKEKERYILVSRYIMGKTQMELAEEIGISQAQISRLEKNGIAKIKKMVL